MTIVHCPSIGILRSDWATISRQSLSRRDQQARPSLEGVLIGGDSIILFKTWADFEEPAQDGVHQRKGSCRLAARCATLDLALSGLPARFVNGLPTTWFLRNAAPPHLLLYRPSLVRLAVRDRPTNSEEHPDTSR